MRLLLVAVLTMYAAGLGAQTMVHPGVLVSGPQLNFVKAEVAAKQEPFYSEFQKAVASPLGAFSYQMMGPPATGVIDCGPYSRPDNGCHAEDADASAAYLQAVLWWITGDRRYADNSIRIMNAYSHALKSYTGSNAPLQAAWSSEMWPRAAEIIRYSHANWSRADIDAFSRMLTGVILPLIHDGSSGNGNWELSMVDGMMGIAVFTNNRELLHHAEAMWQERVPAYFYLSAADGDHPRTLMRKGHTPSWYGQKVFDASTDGVAQETCRDLNHTGYGIAATMNAAETAHIQGGKLYESEQARLVAAMEFHAKFFLGAPVPTSVCGGHLKMGRGYTFVIGYNEYHNRLGLALPLTARWIADGVDRAQEPVDTHMMVFEPLTHSADAASRKH